MHKMELKKPSKDAGWHYIFKDRKEFEDYFLEKEGSVPPLVEDWREGVVGDWVIADDGGVVQILKRNEYHTQVGRYTNTNHYVSTIIGTFKQRPTAKMDTDHTWRDYKKGDRTRFAPLKGKSSGKWWETIPAKKENTYRDKMFVLYLRVAHELAIREKDPNFVSDEALRQAYKGAFGGGYNKHLLLTKAKMLFNQERIQTAMKEGLQQICDDVGLTDKEVMKYYKGIIDKSKDEKVKLEALNKVADIKEITPKSEKMQLGVGVTKYFGMNPNELEDAEQVPQLEE